MKVFKWIDVCISLALIIVFTIEYINDNSGNVLENLISGYFIIGCWQTISMVVHAMEKWHTRKFGTRHIYHWITFISLASLPGFAWILLFTAPFMAVFYTGLCLKECLTRIRRPLSFLKN